MCFCLNILIGILNSVCKKKIILCSIHDVLLPMRQIGGVGGTKTNRNHVALQDPKCLFELHLNPTFHEQKVTTNNTTSNTTK